MHTLSVCCSIQRTTAAVITHRPPNTLLSKPLPPPLVHQVTTPSAPWAVRGRWNTHTAHTIEDILHVLFRWLPRFTASRGPPPPPPQPRHNPSFNSKHSRAPRRSFFFFFWWSPPRLQQIKLVSIFSHIHNRTQVAVVVSNFPTFHSIDHCREPL